MPALTGNAYEMAQPRQRQMFPSASPVRIQQPTTPVVTSQDQKEDEKNQTILPSSKVQTQSSPFDQRMQNALDVIRLWRGEEYVFTPAESQTIEALMASSDNPDEELSKYVAASSMAAMSGYDVQTVYDNLDTISQYFSSKPYEPNDATLAQKVQASFKTVQAQRLMADWKDAFLAGDNETAGQLEAQIQSILDEIGDTQTGVPQSILDEIGNVVIGNLGYIGDVVMQGGTWSLGTTIALTGLVAVSGLNPISAAIAAGSIPLFAAGAGKIGAFKETTRMAEGQSFWDLMHTDEEIQDPAAADVLSLLDGLFVGATETFLDGVTSRGVASIAGKSVDAFGVSMLVDYAGTKANRRFVKPVLDWLTGGLDEGFLNEFPQQIADYQTNSAYKHAIGIREDMDFGDMLGESFDAAVDGMLVGLVYGGLGIPSQMRQYRDTSLELRRQANVTPSREEFFETTKNLKPEGISDSAFKEAQGKIFDAAQMQKAERMDAARKAMSEYMATNYEGTVLESEEISAAERLVTTDQDGNEAYVPDGSIARTPQGRIYAEEQKGDDGTTVVFGDADQGTVYGMLSFKENEDKVTITELRVQPGYESLRPEMVRQTLQDYGFNKQIEWEPTTKGLQGVRQTLIDGNPDGTGLNYRRFTLKPETQALADQIQKNMEGLTRPEAVMSAELYLMADRGALSANNQGRIFGDAKADGIDMTGRRGATNIARSLIYAGQHADVSTFTHELFHATAAVRPAEKTELTNAVRSEATGEGRQALQTFLEDHKEIWGEDFDAESILKSFENLTDSWTRDQEENLARLYEAYRSSTQSRRKSLPEKIRAVLQRLADYVNRIYQTLKDTTPLSANIAQAYDRLTGIERTRSEASTPRATDSVVRFQDKIESEFDSTEEQLKANSANFDDRGRHLAPNGQPSNLPYRQWVMVRTPAFKRWFGDWQTNPANSSKVIDENGEPLLVYHGTYEDFSVFDRTKTRASMDIQGNFFSPWSEDAGGYGPNVRAFFLNLKNPADYRTAYAALEKFKGQDNAGVKAREYLESQGFDGVNFDEEEYIAFEPAQIKSIDNNGNFDYGNPDVYFQEAVNQIDEGIRQSALNADENKEQAVSDYLKENGLDIPSEDVIVLSDNAVIIKDDTGYGYDKEKLEQLKASVYEQLSLFNFGGSDDEPRNTGTAKRRKNPSQRRSRPDSSTPLFPELRGTYPETFSPGSGWSGRERSPQTVEGKWNSFGYVRFIGAQVNSPSDIAKLYSIYRNPQLEYFHIVLLKEGKIVRQIGMSSGLPSVTLAIPYGINSQEELARYFDDEDFDQLYLIHNHPSGNPFPSDEDLSVTARYVKAHPDKDVKHVILDHSTFFLLEAPDKTSIDATSIALSDGIHEIQLRETLSETLSSPLDIASAARRLSDTGTHVFYLSNQHRVFAFDSFDVSDFDKSVSNLLQEMRDKSYATGAIVTDSDSDFSAMRESVRNRRLPVLDIIWIGDKRYISLLEMGELESYRWDRTGIALKSRSEAMKWDSRNNPDVLFQDDFDHIRFQDDYDRRRFTGVFSRPQQTSFYADQMENEGIDPFSPEDTDAAVDTTEAFSPEGYSFFVDAPDDLDGPDLSDPAVWDTLVTSKAENTTNRDYDTLPSAEWTEHTYEDTIAMMMPAIVYEGTDAQKDAIFVSAIRDPESFRRYMQILGESINLNSIDKNGWMEHRHLVIEPYVDQNHREEIQQMVKQRVTDPALQRVSSTLNLRRDADPKLIKAVQSMMIDNARIYRDLFADLTGDKTMKPHNLIRGKLNFQAQTATGYRSMEELARIAQDAGLVQVQRKIENGTLKMDDEDLALLKQVAQGYNALKKQVNNQNRVNMRLGQTIETLKSDISTYDRENAETTRKLDNIKTLLERHLPDDIRNEKTNSEYTTLSRQLQVLESHQRHVNEAMPKDGRSARSKAQQRAAQDIGMKEWKDEMIHAKIFTREELTGKPNAEVQRMADAKRKELKSRLPKLELSYLQGLAFALPSYSSSIKTRLKEMEGELATLKSDSIAKTELRKSIRSLQDKLDRRDNQVDKLKESLTEEKLALQQTRRELTDQVHDLRDLNRQLAIDLEGQYSRMEDHYQRLLKIAQENQSKLTERQKERDALRELRDEKRKYARIIMEPVNLQTVDWETGGQAIISIQALLDPQFRRDWVYDLETNLEGVAGGDTMTFDQAREYFTRIDDEGRAAVAAAIKPQLLQRLIGARKPLNDWTLEELKDLAQQVDSFRRLGRETLKAKNAFLRQQAADLTKSLLETLRPLAGNRLKTMPGTQEEKRSRRSPKAKLQQMEYATRRPQELAQLLDGGYGSYGTAYQLLVDEKRYHQARAVKAIDERLSKIDPLIDKDILAKLTKRHMIDFGDGRSQSYTADDLGYIYLSQFNPANRAAVAFGNFLTSEEKGSSIPKGINKDGTLNREFLTASVIVDDDVLENVGWERYRQALKQATLILQEEGLMPLVDAIRDDFASQGSRLQKMMIDVFNTPMRMEEHYLPIRRQDLTGQDMAADFADSLFNTNNSGIMHNPEKGFTITRQRIRPRQQKATNMSLYSVWKQSVQQQEWLIENAAYGRKLHRVFMNSELSNAINSAYSPDLYKEITDYIDMIANPYRTPRMENQDRILRFLRGNLAAAYLGFKASGIVMQALTSPWPFLSDVSIAELTKGYIDLAQDPGLLQEIYNKSPLMKNRSMDMVVDELIQRVNSSDNPQWQNVLYDFQQKGMLGLEMVDRIAVAGGWLAMYNKTLKSQLDAGYSTETAEAAAIKAADDLVLRVQPTGDRTELASLFRTNNEAWKAILQFQTSLNVIWNNITADIQGYARNREYRKLAGTIAGYAIAGLLMGAVMTGFDDDDEPLDVARDIGYFLTTQFTESMPIIGQELSNVLQKFITGSTDFYGSTSIIPAFDKFTSALRAGADLDLPKAVKYLAQSIGYVTGIPVSGIKQTLGAISDMDPSRLLGRQ